MPTWLGQLGQQAAGQATGGAIAMGIQRLGVNYDNRKQAEQAQRLQDIQIGGEKQLMDYQSGKQLQMWKDTSYPAQMEQLKKAGLNPALMYGEGGGGGTTIGGGMPSVSGGGAQSPNTARAGVEGMGLMSAAQLALMNAQKENINADTANKQAENPNIPKTGAKIEAETNSITQGINNQKAQKTLTDVQSRIANIDANIKEETQDAVIQKIRSETNNAIDTAHIVMKEAGIMDATQQDKINIIKQEAIQKVLESALTRATTTNVKADLPNIQQKLKQMMTDQQQGWQKLRIEEQSQLINKALTETGLDLKDREQIIDAIRDIIGLGLLTNKGGTPATPIKGFHNR